MERIKGRLMNFGDFPAPETVVVLGLPGSGKSHLARRIRSMNPEKDFYIVEDGEYHLCRGMLGKNNLIVADGHMIDGSFFSAVMRDLSESGTPFTCYHFEKDLEKCRRNILSREGHHLTKETAIADLRYYAATYDAKVRAIMSSPLLIEAIEVEVFSPVG